MFKKKLTNDKHTYDLPEAVLAVAQLLRGMWDLPRPGLEPVSPALAGRLSTTAPPGKPLCKF